MPKMICFFLRSLYAGIFAGFLVLPPYSASAETKTYVYAAASLTGAITELVKTFKKTTALPIIPVFGASSTLARQIINGAPADIFISANGLWMDRVENEGLIDPVSRVNIVKNRLVVIAPASNSTPIELSDAEAFHKRLGQGRLAIADPDHVPAGMYGKMALKNLKLWPRVQNRLAIASNVRIALTYVGRAEAPMGIVYASDLIGRTDIKKIATFPESSHIPIVYPAALRRGKSSPTAQAFHQFLQSSKGRAILKQFGFQPL